MGFLGDILLAGAALGAALFCFILSRRLGRLTALDSGMGKAIALLSAQVDELSRSLAAARRTAEGSAATLEAQTRRAEAACRQLELMLASLHDLPAAGTAMSDPGGIRPASPWPGSTQRAQPAAETAGPAAAEAPARLSGAGRARLVRRRAGARPA